MKKRALILAMIAFIAATTSEPSINMVRAEETQVEETQVEETQTEENAGQTSELPIKTLTQKVIEENPYLLEAVISFTAAVMITALCIKFRKRGQKSQTAENYVRKER